ncbi:DeoR family transcriptional regulator [Maricaulis sp. CAU 1757]
MPRRHDAKGRRVKGGQFVPLSYPMAHSDAWRSLGGASAKVYVELRSRFNGGNNGDLSLSYGEAADLLGLGKSTVRRAFEELQAKGFVVKTDGGSWYGRKAATWAVTDRPLVPGGASPNTWQGWRYPKTDPRYSGGTMRAVACRRRTGGEKNF